LLALLNKILEIDTLGGGGFTMAEQAKWVCNVCGYEYDGSAGPFEKLPDSWVCPICGAKKSDFQKK
jgi:rubredoxin